MSRASVLARNDLRQYDELADAWWDPDGPLAMLHWIAEARASLVPPATRSPAVLLDVACGAGLLAPHVQGKGYCHIGVDRTESALIRARSHGVTAARGDVGALPVGDETVDVVCAGEIFEHVADLDGTVAETCRVLRPGGLVVIDTIARTALARFLAITVAERIPGGAPPGIHDPGLLVDRRALVAGYARRGISIHLSGLRPSFVDLLAWKAGRRPAVRMLPTRPTSVLFQARGFKAFR